MIKKHCDICDDADKVVLVQYYIERGDDGAGKTTNFYKNLDLCQSCQLMILKGFVKRLESNGDIPPESLAIYVDSNFDAFKKAKFKSSAATS